MVINIANFNFIGVNTIIITIINNVAIIIVIYSSDVNIITVITPPNSHN